MPLTKNCCRHEVDAAWESEQSRFTISIAIGISRDPLVLIKASMVSNIIDGGVCFSVVGVIINLFMSLHLSCSRLNQGLVAVVGNM